MLPMDLHNALLLLLYLDLSMGRRGVKKTSFPFFFFPSLGLLLMTRQGTDLDYQFIVGLERESVQLGTEGDFSYITLHTS